MTKIVYAYAADDKYIGERILDDTDRSPISGAWQIPGNMTETKPPKEKEGYDIYYKDGRWEYVEQPKEEEPTQSPSEDLDEAQEEYIDPSRIAIAEAFAGLEERIAALEALKGGEGK